MQGLAGNRVVARALQSGPPGAPQRLFGGVFQSVADRVFGRVRRLDTDKGVTREEIALGKMLAYADKHPKGPMPGHESTRDDTFSARLKRSAMRLKLQMEQHESFDKMPARLKALVFTLELLNVSDVPDTEWMKTVRDAEGNVKTQGGASAQVAGSVSRFGENAWKCNKLVADAFAGKEGASVKNFPLGKDKNRLTWSPQANDFGGPGDRLHKSSWDEDTQKMKGKTFTSFPKSELMKLSEDGTAVAEITAYGSDGKPVSVYRLQGKVYKKFEFVDGREVATAETKSLDEITPGNAAGQLGDIVAFESARKGTSGHMGLNLGEDLFISAMNSTQGVGILSIKMHVDPGVWDQYKHVTFRSHRE